MLAKISRITTNIDVNYSDILNKVRFGQPDKLSLRSLGDNVQLKLCHALLWAFHCQRTSVATILSKNSFHHTSFMLMIASFSSLVAHCGNCITQDCQENVVAIRVLGIWSTTIAWLIAHHLLTEGSVRISALLVTYWLYNCCGVISLVWVKTNFHHVIITIAFPTALLFSGSLAKTDRLVVFWRSEAVNAHVSIQLSKDIHVSDQLGSYIDAAVTKDVFCHESVSYSFIALISIAQPASNRGELLCCVTYIAFALSDKKLILHTFFQLTSKVLHVNHGVE